MIKPCILDILYCYIRVKTEFVILLDKNRGDVIPYRHAPNYMVIVIPNPTCSSLSCVYTVVPSIYLYNFGMRVNKSIVVLLNYIAMIA